MDTITAANSIREKIRGALVITADEFFEMGRYLISVRSLAAALQTFIPQSALLAIGNGPVLSVLAMIGIAVLLSICSTVDAFVALGFIGTFSFGAVLLIPRLRADGRYQEHHPVFAGFQTPCGCLYCPDPFHDEPACRRHFQLCVALGGPHAEKNVPFLSSLVIARAVSFFRRQGCQWTAHVLHQPALRAVDPLSEWFSSPSSHRICFPNCGAPADRQEKRTMITTMTISRLLRTCGSCSFRLPLAFSSPHGRWILLHSPQKDSIPRVRWSVLIPAHN